MITSTGVKGFISPQLGPATLKALESFSCMLYFALLRFNNSENETHYKEGLMNRSSSISPRIQHKVFLLQVLTVFAVGSWLLNFLQWSPSVGTDCNF